MIILNIHVLNRKKKTAQNRRWYCRLKAGWTALMPGSFQALVKGPYRRRREARDRGFFQPGLHQQRRHTGHAVLRPRPWRSPGDDACFAH